MFLGMRNSTACEEENICLKNLNRFRIHVTIDCDNKFCDKDILNNIVQSVLDSSKSFGKTFSIETRNTINIFAYSKYISE